MWQARTKNDLIIEVWEKLDCENVGAAEIEAIETVIVSEYGEQARDSPMFIARLLADEGAELRHAEIMSLFVERQSDRPYDSAFRNILNLSDLKSSLTTIKNLDNLRRKYRAGGDATGLRLVREKALSGKRIVSEIAADSRSDVLDKQVSIEISEWFSVWLQTPDLFEDWVALRRRSPSFVEKFGRILED
jgi:hypothetical protein